MDTYLLLLPVEQLPSVMCDVPYAEVRHVEWKVEEGIVGGRKRRVSMVTGKKASIEWK